MRHEMDRERIEGRAGKNAHETVAEDLGKRRDAEAGMDRRFARVVPLVRESVRCRGEQVDDAARRRSLA
jgi:hypothetical protein